MLNADSRSADGGEIGGGSRTVANQTSVVPQAAGRLAPGMVSLRHVGVPATGRLFPAGQRSFAFLPHTTCAGPLGRLAAKHLGRPGRPVAGHGCPLGAAV